MADTSTNKSFWARRRLWIIGAALVLFLPPLAFIFQLTQDSNFCGTWCPRMFFSWRSGQTFGQFMRGFIQSWMGVALVFGVIASTLFIGRQWCSHLCPIGGSMELGSRVMPKWLKLDFSRVPAPHFRYGYLLVYLVAPAIGIGSLCCNYCNFATVPRMAGAAFSMADMSYFLRTAGLINLGLVIVLGFMSRGGRAYCNLICPIGALDALGNWAGRKFGRRVSIDADACNGCGACAKVCPAWAIEEKDGLARVDQLSCMPCRECESVCAKEAISYGKRTRS